MRREATTFPDIAATHSEILVPPMSMPSTAGIVMTASSRPGDRLR